MADTDLPTSGRNTRIELHFNGAPQNIVDHVTDFSVQPTYDTIETKPIGSNRVYHDAQPTGWRGTFTTTSNTPAMADFIDAYNLNKRNGIPQEIRLSDATNYRDGTTRRHTYSSVQVTGMPRTVRRGAATTHRCEWVSGVDRTSSAS